MARASNGSGPGVSEPLAGASRRLTRDLPSRGHRQQRRIDDNSNMDACISCGASVQDNSRFCPSCGSLLTRACPSCGAEVSAAARFCETCGTVLSAAVRAEERKLVTIIFADVTGSTALGEQLDPERLRSLLKTYFDSMAEVISSWGGTIEKFVGDAIVAVFGVPLLREDDAERALHAALEMLERLGTLNEDLNDRHGVKLRIRIGINTGEVLAPVDGPRDQLIVTGDAANVAARLQQAAEPGSILVGERTYLATRGSFRFGQPAEFELKGKGSTVRACRLISATGMAKRGIPGLRAPMVGRIRELRTLSGLLDEAAEMLKPQLVVIYGPAGIGKSRLVQEFVNASSTTHPLKVLKGRCLAMGHGITYWALGEILRDACTISLDDPSDVARLKLETGAENLLQHLDLDADERAHTIQALGLTAGIPIHDSPLERMTPQDVAEELAQSWPRFVTALAATGPCVLIVEDLHWAGEQMIDMIETLVSRTTGALLIVATARPEFAERRPSLSAGDSTSSISLRPLTDDQSHELINGLFDVGELPENVRAEILDKAEGNPFFLEEIIRRLIDEGAIVHEGGRWRATDDAAAISLPDTLHALLGARIDGLPREEKQILQEAAVVGRVFWAAPTTTVLAAADIRGGLKSLERKGLVVARPTSSIVGKLEYTFKHALVRDVAYASLPKTRRARAHAEVGQWIEDLAGDRREEFVELVAHHLAAAVVDPDTDLAWDGAAHELEAVRTKAFVALLNAGDSARRKFAVEKALELHGVARELASDPADQLRVLEALGDDHEAALHGDESFAAYQSALDLLRNSDSRGEDYARLCAKAVAAMAWSGAFRSLPDPGVADALASEGLPAAQEETTRIDLLFASGLAAKVWAWSGERPPDMTERLANVKQGLRYAEAAHDAERIVKGLAALAYCYEIGGEWEAAAATWRRQLEFLEEIVSARDRAEICISVALTDHFRGRPIEDVMPIARRALGFARGLNPHSLMHATSTLALTAYEYGLWDEARAAVDQHMAVYEQEAHVSCPSVRSGPWLAACLLANTGKVGEATEMIDAELARGGGAETGSWACVSALLSAGRLQDATIAAEEFAAADNDEWSEGMALIARLEVARATGNPEPATTSDEIRRLAEAVPKLTPVASRAEGVRVLQRGLTDEARAHLKRAADSFRSLGLVFELAQTLELLAETDATRGKDFWREALDIYDRLGALPHAERLRASASP